jgi:hypothetical protein
MLRIAVQLTASDYLPLTKIAIHGLLSIKDQTLRHLIESGS